VAIAKSVVPEEACGDAVTEGIVPAEACGGVGAVNLVKADFGGAEREYAVAFLFFKVNFFIMPSKHDFAG
jgi:hypothetical protein